MHSFREPQAVELRRDVPDEWAYEGGMKGGSPSSIQRELHPLSWKRVSLYTERAGVSFANVGGTAGVYALVPVFRDEGFFYVINTLSKRYHTGIFPF